MTAAVAWATPGKPCSECVVIAVLRTGNLGEPHFATLRRIDGVEPSVTSTHRERMHRVQKVDYSIRFPRLGAWHSGSAA